MVLSHTHKYQRLKWKTGTLAYKCMRDGCSHFINAELLEGKLCQCYICKDDFTITSKQANAKRPHCDNCRAKGTKVTSSSLKLKSVEELMGTWKERFGI